MGYWVPMKEQDPSGRSTEEDCCCSISKSTDVPGDKTPSNYFSITCCTRISRRSSPDLVIRINPGNIFFSASHSTCSGFYWFCGNGTLKHGTHCTYTSPKILINKNNPENCALTHRQNQTKIHKATRVQWLHDISPKGLRSNQGQLQINSA